MLLKVSAPPSCIAKVKSGEQRRKSLRFAVRFVDRFKLAGHKIQRRHIVPFGDNGHIVDAELTGSPLIDLDKEPQISRRPARNNGSRRPLAAIVWRKRDVRALQSVPSQRCRETID